MESTKLNIYQRLNKVMTEVTYLQKDGEIRTKNGTYKVITHDAVTAAIRESMVDNGILPVISDLDFKQEETRSTIVIRIELVNVDVPTDRIEAIYHGIGDDFGDKGPGKARSIAVKNAYLKILMLETGESDESHTGPRNEQEELTQAILDNAESIHVIKSALTGEDLSTAAEAWFELEDVVKQKLWVAPSKGGPFSTKERQAMKSSEFRKSYYGEENAIVQSNDSAGTSGKGS
ncbi:MAG: ERF family protein [bacterium]